MRIFICLCTLYVVLSCNSSKKGSIPDFCFGDGYLRNAQRVSLRNINKLKMLNDTYVQVDGFLHYSFEDVALYPSMNSKPEEAIWLSLKFPKEISDIDIERLDGLYITIVGKVDTLNKGHYGAYFASLDSALCIKVKE